MNSQGVGLTLEVAASWLQDGLHHYYCYSSSCYCCYCCCYYYDDDGDKDGYDWDCDYDRDQRPRLTTTANTTNNNIYRATITTPTTSSPLRPASVRLQPAPPADYSYCVFCYDRIFNPARISSPASCSELHSLRKAPTNLKAVRDRTFDGLNHGLPFGAERDAAVSCLQHVGLVGVCIWFGSTLRMPAV